MTNKTPYEVGFMNGSNDGFIGKYLYKNPYEENTKEFIDYRIGYFKGWDVYNSNLD